VWPIDADDDGIIEADNNGTTIPGGVDERGTIQVKLAGKWLKLSFEGAYTMYDYNDDAYPEDFADVPGIYLPLAGKTVTFTKANSERSDYSNLGYYFDGALVLSPAGSTPADAVVVLTAAMLEGERLTFDVHVLEGSLGKADGPASVFIDTLWWGLGSNGFTYYGQSQTTGGETPNIGDPHGTSTFSGWSNPSPTQPYVRPPMDGGRAVGAPPPPDIDPRYQQRYNQPTCGKPPLLPCY
jgi:hypothetical protein